jgi:hypothetical protein
MNNRQLLFLASAICLLMMASSASAQATTIQVPMRDGVKLATDTYRADAVKQAPVVLMRTPYDRTKQKVVHIRTEVLEKPAGGAPTTWTLCYIPNKGLKSGYGCTGTEVYKEKGVYERDVKMTSFWQNDRGRVERSAGGRGSAIHSYSLRRRT